MSVVPRISVVMATYNRAETLKSTLDHLARQSLPPAEFEVIVVDDGSPDNTEQVVSERRASLPFSLTYLRHANQGPGYTQNRGLKEARAPIVCLMADDIFLAAGALEAHVRAHERYGEPAVAVLGKVMQSPALNQSVFLRKWDPFKFRDLEGMNELPYYFFWACNISFKRDFMLAHGMFRDEKGRAGAAAHEDVELGYRLSLHGLRIHYCGEACGHHYHIETLDGACRRAYERGLNWGDFRKLVADPEISVRYHVFNRHTLSDYLWTFRRRHSQIGADRNPLLLLGRIALRTLLFNVVTVKGFWLPLAHAAERNAFAARLMHRQLYRGIISFHFFRGVAHGDKAYRDNAGAGPRVPQC